MSRDKLLDVICKHTELEYGANESLGCYTAWDTSLMRAALWIFSDRSQSS